MSHYYAKISESARKTTPTARGHKSTGITTQAACADGGIEVSLWHKEGKDFFKVERIPWSYGGQSRGYKELLAEGTLNEEAML